MYDENKYNILYGEPGAKEERLLGYEELDSDGNSNGKATETYPAWHTRWDISRDGGMGYSEEWEPGNSWTAKKIVRPSYSLDSAVWLHVNVYGRNRGGRCQPYLWSAAVEFRSHRRTVSQILKTHGCKSVKDAIRKAEALQIDGAIANLLTEAFSPARAAALFKLNKNGEYEPFASMFSPHIKTDLEIGKYFEVQWRWNRKYEERGQSHLSAYEIEKTYWGSNMRHNPEEHKFIVEKLGCWLPKPIYTESQVPLP